MGFLCVKQPCSSKTDSSDIFVVHCFLPVCFFRQTPHNNTVLVHVVKSSIKHMHVHVRIVAEKI